MFNNTIVFPEFSVVRYFTILIIITAIFLTVVNFIRSKLNFKYSIPSKILYLLQTILTFIFISLVTLVIDVSFFDSRLWYRRVECGTCPEGVVCNLTCIPHLRIITPLLTLFLSIYLTHLTPKPKSKSKHPKR